MSPRTALIGAALIAVAPLFATQASAAADPAAAAISARWQKHELNFDYHGFTSFYTCDGLEDKVRQILVHFGARKDAKVRATGCLSPDKPSATAWVKVQFESLGEAGSSGGSDTVAASWQPVELRPNRPSSMGQGECEIVEKIKPVLTAGFALQNLEYRTNCLPHQISLDDYSVRGKVLQPMPAK
jgi:hypothetical protein